LRGRRVRDRSRPQHPAGLWWLGSQFIVPAAPQLDADKFVVGPDIFLFGFSRGAFTARSLGGIINYLGLPKITLSGTDPTRVPPCDHPAVMSPESVRGIARLRRSAPAVVEKKRPMPCCERSHNTIADADKFRATMTVFPVRIHCLCVWDTVGRWGTQGFDYAWIPRFSSKYEFHDTRSAAA